MMKKLITTFIFLFMIAGSVQAQFQSVQNGDWNDPQTWSTNPDATALPDSTTSVIISHTVTVRGQYNINYVPHCYDLTVEANGYLNNYSSTWTTGDLTVHNNLYNYGTIAPAYEMRLTIKGDYYNYGALLKRTVGYGHLNIYSYGDIKNYGSFRAESAGATSFYHYGINFKGNNPHHIQTFNDSTIYVTGITIADTLGYVVADSLASLSAVINLNNSKIVLPPEDIHPNNLDIIGNKIYGGEVIANGNSIQAWSAPELGSLQGDENNLIIHDAILEGVFRTDGVQNYNATSLVMFKGSTILNGVIENVYSTSTDYHGIFIDGDFTNNGTLRNNAAGDFLTINVLNSNFINNSELDAYGIMFYDDSQFSTTDSLAVSIFNASNPNSTVTVTSGELNFIDKTVTVDFHGGTLNLPNGSKFKTYYLWYNRLQNININANGSDFGFACVNNEAQVNNPKISGGVYYIVNSLLTGEIEVTPSGAIFPASGSYPHVIIDGNISNYGKIENFSGSSSLYLEITGNILYDGKSWANQETKLNGTENQNIIIPNDSVWTGKVILDAMISGTNYQWQKDGADISGANGQTLDFNSGISTSDYGLYQCFVNGIPSREILIGNTLPPAFEITDVVIKAISPTSVNIFWKTTEPATGFIFYAEGNTDSGYPFEAMEPIGYRTSHSMLLENLDVDSTYYFIIDQNDEAFNNIRSGEFSFVAGDLTLGALTINSIVDVPNDQGGWVQVNFDADLLDNSGEIRLYGVWEFSGSEWVSLGSVPATQDSAYTFLAHTYADSNSDGLSWSKFYISAHTPDPLIYFNSQPDSGYSVDNIAPAVPEGLLAEPASDGSVVTLTWNRNTEADFAYYKIFKNNEEFATTIDTIFIDNEVIEGNYTYKIQACDANGNLSEFSEEVSVLVGVEEETEIPTEFSISQNYPNPFNPSTTIKFGIPKSSNVQVRVYNSIGQEAAVLTNREYTPGFYEIIWDASRFSSGIYYYTISTNDFKQTKKMLLLK
jgi:hypothetical protein